MSKSSSGLTVKNVGLVLGPLLFALILIVADFVPGKPAVTYTAAIAALIATWWITEAIPIPVTSLLPFVLFPILGILPAKAVAPQYMNSSIFLFMGGFIMALAIEKHNLHRRIALNIISIIGDKPRRMVLGFMIATAVLSMWISNTTTAKLHNHIGYILGRLGNIPKAIGYFRKSDEIWPGNIDAKNNLQALRMHQKQ
ncbi:MAG: hypothetical protein GY855_01385 [candidate division Zixibacteria bacterium]|nr:hypothetical protein [candidate division Zixibacteria bacterium]